jgi:hypothetical protein
MSDLYYLCLYSSTLPHLSRRRICLQYLVIDVNVKLNFAKNKLGNVRTSPKECKHHRETWTPWTPVTCHWIRSILGLLGPLEGYLFDNNIYFVRTYLPSDTCAHRKIEIIGVGRLKLCQE